MKNFTKVFNSINLMNTLITIQIVCPYSEIYKAKILIEECFNEFNRIVKKYTRFSNDSELSKLNSSQNKWINLDEEFFYLVSYILEIAKITNGIFDPTIIDLLEMYGYSSKYDFDVLENSSLVDKIKQYAKTRPSYRSIKIDVERKAVMLVNNQRLELGAVGKGYAIDCAYEILDHHFDNFIIDAGGDIRSKGKNENSEYWKIGLKTEKGIRNYVYLDNQSISCSGNWARKVKYFHHLLNPENGEPIKTDYSTVYVVAPTAIESDTWATVSFLVGPENIKKIIPEEFVYYYF